MSKGQQRRAEVVNRVLSGRVSKDEAEMVLGLSRRQVSRVLNGYRESSAEREKRNGTHGLRLDLFLPGSASAIANDVIFGVMGATVLM